MDLKNYILLGALFIGLLACQKSDPEEAISDSRQPIGVKASLGNEHTRTALDGTDFADKDSFVLFHGAPSTNNTNHSMYVYTASPKGWTGNPGLFWDDLDIWSTGGVIVNQPAEFTALLTNGGALQLGATTGDHSSFTVASNQHVKSDGDYLKNDLLVAYGKTTVNDAVPDDRKLPLTFKHLFSQLKIVLNETTNDAFPILGDTTTLTIYNALTESEIVFDPSLQLTTVTPVGTPSEVGVTMRRVPGETNQYIAILPAQDVSSSAVLKIAGNENRKEYTYSLNNNKTTEGLFIEGKTVILSLNIEKTEVLFKQLVIEPWEDKKAEGEATPDGYPEITIGDKEDGDDGEIDTGEDDYAGKTIKLTSDVTAGLGDGNDLKIPIGTKSAPFRGTFDGQGYTIYLNDIDDNMEFMAVFGYTEGATIKNVNIVGSNLKNSNTSNATATGGLAGYVMNTRIENCHVSFTGEIYAENDNAGGLVGYVNGATKILNSSAQANVYAKHDYAGGLIGRCQEVMSITACFAIGNVTATGFYAGGLIGATEQGTFEYCYAWGNVSAYRFAGGLIGTATGSLIFNSYAAGASISGGANQGSLIGYSKATPQYCYWNSAVTSGKGSTGDTLDNTNYGFSLVKTEAAMGTVLNGLNRNREGEEPLQVWKLYKRQDGYILPVLINNEGSAQP
ncbi:fimbrillin family protein [Odoribacter sp. OttesenSCG-928-J03]|nr:fimbrillin family protein [Odoribacter sp. OttesenSCG-928-J03]MDL2330616.1 fimbrillin family protein [Odoribacter sp. OttesenSCG-928-A06]